jgi:hypothetical protein
LVQFGSGHGRRYFHIISSYIIEISSISNQIFDAEFSSSRRIGVSQDMIADDRNVIYSLFEIISFRDTMHYAFGSQNYHNKNSLKLFAYLLSNLASVQQNRSLAHIYQRIYAETVDHVQLVVLLNDYLASVADVQPGVQYSRCRGVLTNEEVNDEIRKYKTHFLEGNVPPSHKNKYTNRFPNLNYLPSLEEMNDFLTSFRFTNYNTISVHIPLNRIEHDFQQNLRDLLSQVFGGSPNFLKDLVSQNSFLSYDPDESMLSNLRYLIEMYAKIATKPQTPFLIEDNFNPGQCNIATGYLSFGINNEIYREKIYSYNQNNQFETISATSFLEDEHPNIVNLVKEQFENALNRIGLWQSFQHQQYLTINHSEGALFCELRRNMLRMIQSLVIKILSKQKDEKEKIVLKDLTLYIFSSQICCPKCENFLCENFAETVGLITTLLTNIFGQRFSSLPGIQLQKKYFYVHYKKYPPSKHVVDSLAKDFSYRSFYQYNFLQSILQTNHGLPNEELNTFYLSCEGGYELNRNYFRRIADQVCLNQGIQFV